MTPPSAGAKPSTRKAKATTKTRAKHTTKAAKNAPTSTTTPTTTKRKVSVSLDEDLVEELEANGANLSAEINDAIRARVQHLKHLRALGEFLDRLDEEEGPVPQEIMDEVREWFT